MATQHPDNASVPFWKHDRDPFVSVQDEPAECITCFRDLGVNEFMWDWEGKYADESVIEKLFSSHFAFFKKHPLGRDIFLTFRLPNVWKEKGYSLIRALMVILTSEDVAQDLKYRVRPLFEAILPMTERAEQIMYIHDAFEKLVRFKVATFNHRASSNSEYLHLVPLIEGVDDQVRVRSLLRSYVQLHRKHYKKSPAYLRPFLARSDPALLSGFIPNVLANKIALSEIYAFGEEAGIPTYPWIGAGSLVFRGGLSPIRVPQFLDEYRGIRTVTVQSAFRYDYPLRTVKQAIVTINRTISRGRVQAVSEADRPILERIIERFTETYRDTLRGIVADLEPLFAACPRRRERRQHIGLLSYKREASGISLPRAINFCAGFYSLGVPPEFIGLGRSLAALSPHEVSVLRKYYRHLESDAVEAGRYLNHNNLARLVGGNKKWDALVNDVERTENFFRVRLGPRQKREFLHEALSSQLFLLRDEPKEVARLIAETGVLRRSLG